MIENKQRFISQVFTSKAPARVMQEIDDTALSYAEIKALATGNPLIIEHANLETEVNKLKVLYGSHLSQKYELEDRVLRHYPQEISSLTEQIAGCTADITLRDGNTPTEKDTFPPMQILDVTYTEKAKAGKALIEACKKVDSSGALALGTYRGFAMSLSFEPFSKEYRVALKGTLSHSTSLGDDVYGNLTRIDNLLNGLESKRKNQEVQLANTRAQMQAAQEDAQKPFAREEELQAKSKRLAEITKLLKLDEQDRVLLDDGPDAGDDAGEPAGKKKDTRER